MPYMDNLRNKLEVAKSLGTGFANCLHAAKQVRALLDRAHAVSRLWDDAPVVLCGDFNCTPKVVAICNGFSYLLFAIGEHFFLLVLFFFIPFFFNLLFLIACHLM